MTDSSKYTYESSVRTKGVAGVAEVTAQICEIDGMEISRLEVDRQVGERANHASGSARNKDPAGNGAFRNASFPGDRRYRDLEIRPAQQRHAHRH